MYLVVSKWEVMPGREEEFETAVRQIVPMMREQTGVELFEVMKTERPYLMIHGYRDESTFHRLINNPSGDFSRLMRETRAELLAHPVGIDKGEAIDMTTPTFSF